MPRAGDVVLADFVGATGVKRRPAVVVSSDLYHAHHPDVVLSVLTSQVRGATTPTDYVLKDWTAAGLHAPSAFRAYMGTYAASAIRVIGRLSDRDWREVQTRLKLALAVS
jgi:mRNA interferase MazF